MSSSQGYPALTGSITPDQLCGDVEAGTVCTDWYAPVSQFAYDQAYMTPYPSSTVESQPWNPYARASIPDISTTTYTSSHQSPHFTSQAGSNAQSRPRSSPSTFGPSPESISWTSSSGLGIQYTTTSSQPTPPVTSTFPPDIFQAYPTEELYSNSSPPELRQPQPRRPYQSIAPNPAGLAKRRRDEEENEQEDRHGKKRKRTSSVASADLSEDDRFLVQLKESESLPWKDIASRFQSDKGKNFQVAALQMRYKRLREKFRVWEDKDVKALKMAHEYWDKYKWEIIGTKMLDFGISERWPARHCQRKWQQMELISQATYGTTAGMTPAMSHYSSPVEPPMHFGFMPI